ncbi:lipid asymmetry maintenance protein MlaB [Endozoicomonas sp.]|uniref:STAS domain-containing protein n=1 Tax=Endozoicomonas sp. TaxID=1892382 RepID=UPI00288443AE|nr:STAS domain-containing protein [Endozoicomonas sp.]
MTLDVLAHGRLKLSGAITVDTAPAIEKQGRELLLASICPSQAPHAADHWEISLQGVTQADSSALSVCLSWIRLAREEDKTIAFTNIPHKLEALAQVCGIHQLLVSLSSS